MANYHKYDIDHDGVLEMEDVDHVKVLEEIERLNRKQAAQRRMAWVAMWSMIVFTIVLFSPIVSDSRVNALADLLGLFYIAQAGVVGAFMGVSAWMERNNSNNRPSIPTITKPGKRDE